MFSGLTSSLGNCAETETKKGTAMPEAANTIDHRIKPRGTSWHPESVSNALSHLYLITYQMLSLSPNFVYKFFMKRYVIS